MMLERAALEQLDREALIALVLAQQARITVLAGQVAALAARVDELGGRAPSPPPAAPLPLFVKPARAAKAHQGERKRRGQGCGRRRMAPTRTVEHALAACPDCGAALAGGEVVRRRQVLHIPPAPVEVVEHVARRRVCPGCGRAHTPPLDLGAEAFGQQRLSSDTLAYLAALRAVGRLPLRAIQWLLAARHGLRLSLGGLAGMLRAVADRAQPALDELRERVRGSPVVNADETGWREGGANGYAWFFGTREHRSFHYNASRGGAVVAEVLGAGFAGTLVSDFYAGYNAYVGPHQRCWAHLLRDAHDLRAAHPGDAGVAAWADGLHALFLEAKRQAARDQPAPDRRAAWDALERQLAALCRPFWGADCAAPQATLCRRVDLFLDELLMFVADPAVPADNNLAERSLRPLVIARKVSGGSRSPDGSRVTMALASLFATWQAQDRDPLQACQQMLLAQTL
jgi:transposase